MNDKTKNIFKIIVVTPTENIEYSTIQLHRIEEVKLYQEEFLGGTISEVSEGIKYRGYDEDGNILLEVPQTLSVIVIFDSYTIDTDDKKVSNPDRETGMYNS